MALREAEGAAVVLDGEQVSEPRYVVLSTAREQVMEHLDEDQYKDRHAI